MKQVKLIAALVIAHLTLVGSVSASDTLLCKVTEDHAVGWMPKTFLIALPVSEDYSDAEIILPKMHVVSFANWSKGWFQGSDEWKLEGLVKEKDVKKLVPRSQFDHRYELNIKKSDLSFKTFMTVRTSGDWVSNNLQTRGSCEKWPFPTGSAVSRLSDGDVCAFAITYEKIGNDYKPVWDNRYQQFSEEAGNRGLDCGTGKPKRQTGPKTDNSSTNRQASKSSDVILEINSSSGPETLLLVSCGSSPVTLTAVAFGNLPSSGEGLWRPIGGKFKSFDYIKITDATIQLKTTWDDLRVWGKASLQGFELLVADASVTPIILPVNEKQWTKILAYAGRCN